MVSKKMIAAGDERPRVFIASSSEGLSIANAIHLNLDNDYQCTVWSHGCFSIGVSNLDNLYSFLSDYDFAIVIATPDDRILHRGKTYTSSRDNIIFELGLFMGGLGLDRVILVAPYERGSMHLPTDIDGITYCTYNADRHDQNIFAATGGACTRIRQHINERIKTKTVSQKKMWTRTHVGSICFRVLRKRVQFLVVSTTNNRTIFPKGHLRSEDKDIVAGVSRVAKREAGAVGRVIHGESKNINYYNDHAQVINRIEVMLMEVTQVFSAEQAFRDPVWHDLNSAIVKMTEGRDSHTGHEITKVLEWAQRRVLKVFEI